MSLCLCHTALSAAGAAHVGLQCDGAQLQGLCRCGTREAARVTQQCQARGPADSTGIVRRAAPSRCRAPKWTQDAALMWPGSAECCAASRASQQPLEALTVTVA